jgi:translation initiation factor 2B subunit (eIF-2B alpha/beta/delta family)
LANELDHTHLVLLGASAVLADRSLIVPRGSSNIIYLSRSLNVPTVVIVKPSQFIDKVSHFQRLFSLLILMLRPYVYVLQDLTFGVG